MATAQSEPLAWRANLRPPFMVKFIQMREAICSVNRLARMANWLCWVWMELLLHENKTSRPSRVPDGKWLFQQMKDASSIDTVRHSRGCVQSCQSIRGLTNNLPRRRFQRLLIREIRLKWMSMFRAVIGPRR